MQTENQSLPFFNEDDFDHLPQQWAELQHYLQEITGKEVTLNGVLYLIGIQELGQGVRSFSKEEKQDLMHIAVCRLLASLGIYTLEGKDPQGWPIWRATQKLPFVDLLSQEKLLQKQAIEYFKTQVWS